MNPNQIVIGFLVSMFGGALVLWLVIDKWAWPYTAEKLGIKAQGRGYLKLPMGILERGLYTAAFMVGIPEWIAVWLAVKVAISFKQERPEGTVNIYLIGNALSILIALIGAWIALGELPDLTLQR